MALPQPGRYAMWLSKGQAIGMLYKTIPFSDPGTPDNTISRDPGVDYTFPSVASGICLWNAVPLNITLADVPINILAPVVWRHVPPLFP